MVDLSSLKGKNMGVTTLYKVPAQMRCWQCESDWKFKKEIKMWITSTLKQAELSDVIIWKCKCGKSKAEKVDKGDGGRFWLGGG